MKIRFSGFGGQGIVMAGLITGAAAVSDGKNALQTQSYGSASRGGACKSDVVISNDEINDLEFHQPDVLVCLSQEAYGMYGKGLPQDGILLIDRDLVQLNEVGDRTYRVAATELGYEKFGRKIVGNLIMLGFMTAISRAVTKKSMQASIRERVPKGTEKMNLEAFDLGYRLGRHALAGGETS